MESDDVRRAQAFPSTRWSLLLARPGESGTARRAAVEALAARYWRPVAAYVRTRWAPSDEEAREATQDFFLWVLESGFLERADPERGSFRGFVKRSLANFLHDRERRRRTEKRGGAAHVQSIIGDDGAPLDVPDAAGRSPETVLDDEWRRELLAQAADGLEAELRARDKERTFLVFRDYYLGEEDLDYEAVAERHGVSTVDVSNALQFAKKRYRALLRRAVLETVGDDEGLRAELAWLFEESDSS